jgi:hypothetical protein
MPKGIEGNALAGAGTAQSQAGAAYGTVNPIYTSMATSPQGYTPQEKANMITQSGQSLGGGNAAVVGQGALQTARTGNAGGAGIVADDAARASMAQQSTNTLGVDAQDAALKRQQQQIGLNGLNSIYAGANGTANSYLNTANTAAANNPWLKLATAGIAAGGQAAAGAGY